MNNKAKYNINTKLIDDFKIEEIDERQEEGLIYYLDHKVQGVSWVSEEVITSLLADTLPKLPLDVCVWFFVMIFGVAGICVCIFLFIEIARKKIHILALPIVMIPFLLNLWGLLILIGIASGNI